MVNYKTQFGLLGNANPATLKFYYWDPEDTCNFLFVLYPAVELKEIFDKPEGEEECWRRAVNLHRGFKSYRSDAFTRLDKYEKTEVEFIEFLAKIYDDDSTFVGVYSIIYDIDVLNKIVSPLYEASDGIETRNFELFIFANEENFLT